MDSLEGMISRVLFHNEDNGYTVASFLVELEKSQINNKNRLLNNRITVVGCFDRRPFDDEEYILNGEFVKDPKFGLQFRFSSFDRKTLQSKYGIISYLSSELFTGVGVKAATLVVETLGTQAIDKIRNDESVLDAINISSSQKKTIINGIKKDQHLQKQMIFLLNHGISIDMANKIINSLGDVDIIEVLTANPYILMDKVERFGFKKADQFAFSLGIEKTALCRLKALLCFGLKEVLYSSGNSYIGKFELYQALQQYLQEEIDRNLYEEILNVLEEEQRIIIDDQNNVFDYKNYLAEIDLAKEISLFLKDERNGDEGITKFDPQAIELAFAAVKELSHLEFSYEQVQAIKNAFTCPIVIITGGPGTGKTTIVHAIIRMYLRLNQDNQVLSEAIALLAPTGRAAKRLKETTNMQASTIHKYLGYYGENHFTYNKYNRTSARLIIVDEASMMDLPLASRLITSMHPAARLIIVGDVDQLPSVGPGQVLKDLIDSQMIKTIRLTKIHRQASDSSIIKLAHTINEGYLPSDLLEKLPDRNFIPTTKDHLTALVVDLYLKSLAKGKLVKDIEVLIPMYRGNSGINEINYQIQNAVNPLNETGELKHLNHVFRLNDKVIQLVNRAEKGVMNGDIGYVQGFIYRNDKIVGLNVIFDVLIVSYTADELEDLSLAYAISIHKSQGSEFDLVIIPFTTEYYVMLKRKLIYTAVTRAKKTLMLIGDANALNLGIKRIETERKTILKERIIDFMNPKTLKQEIQKMEQVTNSYEDEHSLGEIDIILGEEE